MLSGLKPPMTQSDQQPMEHERKSNKLIKCSVKKFVNFTCSSGDLELFATAGPTALEGQKAHKILQSRKSPQEQAEVKVECTIETLSRKLKLSGRIDLLNPTAEKPTVSEIKSCYAPPHKLSQHKVSLHWAQLKIYGYCVLQNLQDKNNNNQATVTLRLIWYNLIADEIIVDEQLFNFDDLQSFVNDAAKKYIEWITLIEKQYNETLNSASQLQFPHGDFRTGQRDMAASVYLAARDGFHLMCEAPTGIGKTVSTLFPSIKAIGNGDIDRIIYLTAKNSGRQTANECIKQMAKCGLKLSAITITSKKTSCHCTNGTCERNPTDGTCPLTIGFFDRLPEARLKLIRSGIITPDTIDDAAHEHALCPFELTLQLLPWVQLVICDFNYVFDPLVQLAALSENTKRQLLLVDEAHNLTDRARSMFSATLDKRELKNAIADLDKNTLYAKKLQSLVRALERTGKARSDTEFSLTEKPKTISRAIKPCIQSLKNDSEIPIRITESIAEAGKALFRYAVIEEFFNNHHRCIVLNKSNGKYKNTVVTLQCLNATEQLARTYKLYRASVTFSATMRPQQFYRTSLGLPEETRLLTLDSPFNPRQQCTLICDWVDTRYKSRTQSVSSIVDIIASVYFAKSGNYQVYFASYAFMELVATAFQSKHPTVEIIIQKRGSSETQRHDFLVNFQRNQTVLAFSIMGGIYGEAVDYSGDQLIGSIVVGTGLASISLTQQLIETDFRDSGRDGFDYASRYPGFTRVLQAGGRVIRSETDRGVVVLVDQRFSHQFYTGLFPTHWQPSQCGTLATMEACLETFWNTPE